MTVTWTVTGGAVDGRQAFDTALPGDWQPVIAQAFDTWAAAANLTFQFVATDSAGINIRLGGIGELDGPSNVLALSTVSFLGDSIQFADIQFDLAEDFTLFGISDSISVFTTALHEIGHALGLDHEDRVDALMNSNYDQDIQTLLPDDRAAIQAIYGAPGADAPPVPANNDDGTLVGTSAADSVNVGDGGVAAYGLGGADALTGGTAGDALFGNAGFDTLTGADGDDTLRGQLADDSLTGDAGADLLLGGAGNDVLDGGAGMDTASGQSGDDTVAGGADDDIVRGGGGHDSLAGNDGDDTVVGHAGDDTLLGDAGDDLLIGGPGDDSLSGGLGADTIVAATGQGDDTIADFEIGLDRISLVGIAAFADLFIEQADAGATVSVDGLRLTLSGVAAADLGADDFIFS